MSPQTIPQKTRILGASKIRDTGRMPGCASAADVDDVDDAAEGVARGRDVVGKVVANEEETEEGWPETEARWSSITHTTAVLPEFGVRQGTHNKQ